MDNYYDILVGLDILTQLGFGCDRRLRPPLDILMEKRRGDGTLLESGIEAFDEICVRLKFNLENNLPG